MKSKLRPTAANTEWHGGGSAVPGTPPGSIAELLEKRSRDQPERHAILAPGRSALSYAQLWAQAQYVHGCLRSLGLSRDTRVAVVVPNGPEMAAAFLSVAASATCCPLNPQSPEAELRSCFHDLRIGALLVPKGTGGAARSAAEAAGVTVIEMDACPSQPAGAFALSTGALAAGRSAPTDAEPEDVALILQTSGTTAKPKVVPLTQANLLFSASNIARHYALAPDDCCLNVMPLFHIHGLVGALLATVWAGSRIVCTPGFSPAEFAGWVEKFQPTWYTAVPSIHQAVLALGPEYRRTAGSHRFRFVRSCSAPLPPAVMASLESLLDAPVLEAYGMTEASHQVASNALPPWRRIVGSVGAAVGIEVGIIDAMGHPVRAAETGEVVIRGPGVVKAYEGNPDANAMAFNNGWFRTGDQGHIDRKGNLFLSGRLKEIVNRGGEKISPREVDDAMLEHPGVAEAATFPVPHPVLGEDLAAAVVLRPGASVGEQELRAFLLSRLSAFKVPARILFVDAIPKGATGKVQRSLIHAALAPLLATDYVAPRDDFEIALATAWARVLEREQVGIADNFVQLGGSSLDALTLTLEMEQVTGMRFELADVFRFPTIAALSEHVRSGAGKVASIVVPLQVEGSGVPVFCLYGTSLYRSFAQCLGKGHPVYGVFVQEEQYIVDDVLKGKSPDISIEKLVEAYDAAIRRFRPEGPYRLAGFSLGGIIAFELATRMRARGEQVELVMLLDTVLAHGREINIKKWVLRAATALVSGRALARIRAAVARRIGLGGDKARAAPDSREVAAAQVVAFRRAARKWVPNQRAADFKVVLFRSTDAQRSAPYVSLLADYGWRRVLGHDIDIVTVSGSHRGMLEPPHVQALASAASRFLESA